MNGEWREVERARGEEEVGTVFGIYFNEIIVIIMQFYLDFIKISPLSTTKTQVHF